MRLTLAVLAPRVQRVVQHDAVTEHGMVVAAVERQAARDGQQAGALGRILGMTAICRAHDARHRVLRCLRQCVLGEEGIETARLAVMPRFHARRIEGSRAAALRHGQHFVCRHVEKPGTWIDGTRHQPGTGDAVDLGMPADAFST